jgi:hypothetical protein
LLDENGSEIPVAGGDNLIFGATNAAWLADGATIAYLTVAPPEERPPMSETPPNKDTSYIVNRLQPAVGSGKPMNSAGKFAAVVWNPAKSSGVGIVSSPLMAPNIPHPIGPVDLVALDFTKEAVRDVAPLEGYAGGLSVSPSGDKVAYWVGKEQLEVRDIGAPNRVTRVRVLLGTLGWAGDEKRVLVKQGAPSKSGSLVWISLPQLAPVAVGTSPETHDIGLQSVLHDLEFRQFEISPDGKSLAVVEPGRRNLLVYSLPLVPRR